MTTKKYQVFVSSTFRDLVEERQDTIRNILDLNHIPAGMELFPATDVEQLSYIKKVIDECDYYLLIVGGRYGSMDADGVSFTEREYDHAVETGKFIIAFVHGEPEAISIRNSDIKPQIAEALNAFRAKIMKGRLVREWSSRQDLQLVVLKSLIHAFSAFPQTGWIRGDAAANEQVLESSNRALQENAELRAQVAKLTMSQMPKYDDLADLNDEFEFRYQTRRASQSRTNPYLYADRTFKLSWRQIFIYIAAQLGTPKTSSSISIALKKAIADDRSAYTPYSINETDIAIIQAQFVALGLIKAEIGKSIKDTYHEYLSLTTKGHETYMNAVVVRK